MPSLRSILFLLTIWAFAMGCGSEKPAPFVGDSQNNKSDASTTMPDAAMPDVVTTDADMPIDTGSQPPNLCTDAGNCSVILTAERLIIPADGKSTNLITATVGDVRLGGMIDFSITGPGRWENNRNTIPALVDSNGKARATFSSDASGGTAIVTARLVGRDMAASLTIEMPQLADITYTKQHTLMGVNSSGFNESNNITFKILAPNGAPYPAGLTVNLEHKPLSGSKINNKTCTMLDCAIKETGVTDDKGLVNVVLDSGQLQGTAIVSINATAGGQTKNVTVDTPIVGAKVSGRNVSIECTPRNVPALVDTDCIRSRVDTPFKCTVTLGDRFNNVVGVSTTVKYQSEAGIVGTPPTTPQYPNPDLGKATGTIGTVGGVLPVDVFPIMGEFSMQMDDNCHPAGSLPTHNPRDGIVSVIAMVAGEEGFIDKDGDGTYDQGEPFIDLPEPFVDSNDNGVLDPGEFFQDLNMDFQWNPANNVWDSSTTLWTETRVVYTGKPESLTDMTGTDYLSRYFFPGTPLPAGSLNVGRIELMPDEGRDLGLWFSDWNFNVLAPTVKYSVEIGMGDPITASLSGTPPMRPEREEGFFFAQQYCDGAAPASCGMVCPPTPATQRCLVKSAVTQFEYGARGTVRIKGSASLKGGFGVTSVATLPNAIGTIRLDGVVK